MTNADIAIVAVVGVLAVLTVLFVLVAIGQIRRSLRQLDTTEDPQPKPSPYYINKVTMASGQVVYRPFLRLEGHDWSIPLTNTSLDSIEAAEQVIERHKGAQVVRQEVIDYD